MDNQSFFPKQITAEEDFNLNKCFHGKNLITKLIEDRLGIIAGRKGTGKSAISLYIDQNYTEFGLDFARRISVGDLVSKPINAVSKEERTEEVIFFLLTQTIRELLNKDLLIGEYVEFWKNFLTDNGLQDIQSYNAFVEWTNVHQAEVNFKILKGSNETQRERTKISNTTGNIVDALTKGLKDEKRITILVDDLSDSLNRTDRNTIQTEIDIIQDILLRCSRINTEFTQRGLGLRLVCCIRDDLWDHMEPGNTTKLKENSLTLTWNEESFCSLVIRRHKVFAEKIEEALQDPIGAILEQFPNEIFTETLSQSRTKQYRTKFYALMMAISFNRPRDFIKFCYAMAERLSLKHAAELKNIISTEIEYSTYFFSEISDEINLITRLLSGFKSDKDRVNELMQILCQKEDFGFRELKTEMNTYLTHSSDKKTYEFIREMWWYGIIGFSQGKEDIKFKYMYPESTFPSLERGNDYRYALHRGLYWHLILQRSISETNQIPLK